MTQLRIAGFLDSLPAKQPQMPKGARGRQLGLLDVAIDEAQRRAATGEWEEASGKTLVGLYALCHRIVYRVLPDELREPPQFRMAAKQAAGFVHAHFADDFSAAAAFVKWTWEREKRREIWALENGRDRNRLHWRFQFSAGLFTDYQVERKRTRR
jgi:hypothetical protein